MDYFFCFLTFTLFVTSKGQNKISVSLLLDSSIRFNEHWFNENLDGNHFQYLKNFAKNFADTFGISATRRVDVVQFQDSSTSGKISCNSLSTLGQFKSNVDALTNNYDAIANIDIVSGVYEGKKNLLSNLCGGNESFSTAIVVLTSGPQPGSSVSDTLRSFYLLSDTPKTYVVYLNDAASQGTDQYNILTKGIIQRQFPVLQFSDFQSASLALSVVNQVINGSYEQFDVTAWSTFGLCSIQCTKTRYRNCTGQCAGVETIQTLNCTTDFCLPSFGLWSSFSNCSALCQQTRSRSCSGNCQNAITTQTQSCLVTLGAWSDYGICSSSCLHTRVRNCTGNCQNVTTTDSEPCLGDLCQTAILGVWSSFGSCSVSCQQTRSRTCVGNCQSNTISESQSCIGDLCPTVILGEWSSFGNCSSICLQTRSRNCTGSCQNVDTIQKQLCTGGFCLNGQYKIAVSLLLDSSLQFNQLYYNDNFGGDRFQYLKNFVKSFADTIGISANHLVNVIQFQDISTSEVISCDALSTLQSFKAKVDSLTNSYSSNAKVDIVSGINEGKKRLASNLCGSNNNFTTAMVVLTSGPQLGASVDDSLSSFYSLANAPNTYVVYLNQFGSQTTNQYNILTKGLVQRQFPVTQFIGFQSPSLASSVVNQILADTPLFGEWSSFGICTYLCQQSRSRTCSGNCQNAITTETQSCLGDVCPTVILGEWSSFGNCSYLCQQSRSRTCFGSCQNASTTETRSCLGDMCPTVILGEWSSFGNCSNLCQQSRSRTCSGSCQNASTTETRSCLGDMCPTVILGEWSSFGNCSYLCQQSRSRTCSGSCQNASTTETRSCLGDMCPTVILGEWSSFGNCSYLCQQSRSRTCSGSCQNASTTETQSCLGDMCPTVILGEWSSFGNCSNLCQQSRTRTCFGNCQNATTLETQSCFGDLCQNVLLGAWSAYSNCSSLCQQTRSRTCTGNCQNQTIYQTLSCIGGFCPLDQTKIAVSLLLDSSVAFNEAFFPSNFQYLKRFSQNFAETFGVSKNRLIDVIQFSNLLTSETISCNSLSTLQIFKTSVDGLTNSYDLMRNLDLVSGINTAKSKLQSNLCGGNESFATALVILTSGNQLDTLANSLLQSIYLLSDTPKTYVVYINDSFSDLNQYNILTNSIVSRQFPISDFIGFQNPSLAKSVAEQVIANGIVDFSVSDWSLFNQCSNQCQQTRTRICTGQCNTVEISQTQNCTTGLCFSNPCAGKTDGKYLIPDVFAYLSCSLQQATFLNCSDNQIFDPNYSNCMDAGNYSLNNFCVGKTDDQYRNPWNCNSFISCANGAAYNMSCALPNLVYDPYNKLCKDSGTYPCSVLPVLGTWSAYGDCSVLCKQTRVRTCSGNCQNAITSQSQNCLGGFCPVALYGVWSAFSECSTACQKTRTRNCTGNCVNAVILDIQNCTDGQCPSGIYSVWSDWSSCSATCSPTSQDVPFQTRNRICQGETLGRSCFGSSYESRMCNYDIPCPVYTLGNWGTWSSCSQSCRATQTNPMRVRARNCTSNSSTLNQCTSDIMIKYEPCNTDACLTVKSCSSINFTFVFVLDSSSSINPQEWVNEKQFVLNFVNSSDFGLNPNIDIALVNYGSSPKLELSCGAITNKNDFFAFINPLQQRNGGTATNDALLVAEAASKNCTKLNVSPIFILLTDGAENIENNFTKRVETENRIKSKGLLYVGAVGNEVNKTDINRMTRYTINGQDIYYNQFSDSFSNLLANYSSSFYSYIYGILGCETKGQWTTWSDWSACSVVCGVTGYVQRIRSCVSPMTGKIQEDCEADGNLTKIELKICSGPCGTWTNWGPFTDCSETCQSNNASLPTQSRQRFCLNNTLELCLSDNGLGKLQTIPCNVGVICPIRGTWSSWGAWSACSASCDSGVSQRERNCSLPFPSNAGSDCIGDSVQKIVCKLLNCPKVCMIPKRCSCLNATKWNYVPTFNQFQNQGITLETIDKMVGYLNSYAEDNVNATCKACNKMVLSSMKLQLTNQTIQINETIKKLDAIKSNLRDVINCNDIPQNFIALWELYDLMFERSVMLEAVLIEMNAISIRVESAIISCESYGWFHQILSSILRV
ncbi:uncharacterized protein LOC100200012 isoform X2 [Hydra vulgaris]|uniref:uncharacterized protein LOC100200012 isoform X2 n=1 Tax=Hydra vulgaris TaxID=6087 RepID=UPI0032E9F83E